MTHFRDTDPLSGDRPKRATPYMVSLMGILAVTGCESIAVNNDYEKPDKAIPAIVVEPGAVFRDHPFVPSDDIGRGHELSRLSSDSEPILVETESGAYVHDSNDGNGEWYGVPAENLTAAIPDFPTEEDEDGIIWVNRVKASEIIDEG